MANECISVERITDEKYMARCIQLARCGALGAPPNPMVGAVVVCRGAIIGEGYHRRCGGPHAEVNAIRSVRRPELLSQSTLYVSLEPCAHYGKTPPCADLIIEKKIPRVVIGCQDPFARVNGLGIRKLKEAGIDVTVGVLEQECVELNRCFMTFHSQHRPWVQLKWAQSKDGFISHADGTPVALSTPFTRLLVHRIRAYSQAILVGTRTVLTDNPSLLNRHWPGPSPLRLTIDRRGVLPQGLRMNEGETPCHIYKTGNLREILADLYERGVQRLLVEGGASLLRSFMKEGLWDEIRVECCSRYLHEGVRAPEVPACLPATEQIFDGHTLRVIRNVHPESCRECEKM